MPELQNPFIIGDKIFLRALSEADLENPEYLGWLNDFEVMRYMESGRFPATPAKMRSYYDRLNTETSVFFAICDKTNNKHIGNVTLQEIHYVHRRCMLGILIGEKSYWGKGIGTEATFLAIDYGFRRLNLHSIWLGVLCENKGAIRAYEKVGFTIDGKDRESWWADGKWHDTYSMSILAHEHFARLEGKP